MILSYINSSAELLRLKPITISDWGLMHNDAEIAQVCKELETDNLVIYRR